MEIRLKMAAFRISIISLAISACSCVLTTSQFDDSVISYLENHHYKSTAVGVMVDGKMVYTKGFTIGPNSFLSGDATKLWPIGKISESLTALAVLKLFQNGDLDLNETVFGSKGILSDLKPYRNDGTVDDRVYNITVEDLLRHSSGWDASMSPLYDPALNTMYLKQGRKVPDIRDELGTLGTLTTRHIIRYMLNQPLQHEPGTRAVHSVFHYGVLAEIIEVSSGMDYRKYIKKYILELCGMWHTRLGPDHHPSQPADVDTQAAALGWFSNVYDLLRLMKCIDGTGRFRVLSQATVEHIGARDSTLHASSHVWQGLGFLTNQHQAIWQVSTGTAHNALLWHSTMHSAPKHHHPHVSFVFFFESVNASSAVNKHLLSQLVRSVQVWPKTNVFATDLSDVPELAGRTIFKLAVPERHSKAYVNALKTEYYDVIWISAAHNKRGTHFSVVARHEPAGRNYIFESGIRQKTLYDHRNLLRSYHYELQFLQSYISQSHGSTYRYLTLSRKIERKPDVLLGTHTDNRHYKLIFASNREKGYVPAIQSVTFAHGNISNDYLFVRKVHDNYKAYINMHLKNVENIFQQNVDRNRMLQYLDVTDVRGTPMFSAIFAQSQNTKGLFRTNLSADAVLVTIDNNKRHGMVPKIVVGYTENGGKLKYILYLAEYKKA